MVHPVRPVYHESPGERKHLYEGIQSRSIQVKEDERKPRSDLLLKQLLPAPLKCLDLVAIETQLLPPRLNAG